MKTDEEYDEVLKELRKEIGASRNLPVDAVNLIPLVNPEIMRHYADNLVKVGATKDKLENSDQTDDKTTGTADKLDPVRMNRRLDTYLNTHYKVPGQRTA